MSAGGLRVSNDGMQLGKGTGRSACKLHPDQSFGLELPSKYDPKVGFAAAWVEPNTDVCDTKEEFVKTLAEFGVDVEKDVPKRCWHDTIWDSPIRAGPTEPVDFFAGKHADGWDEDIQHPLYDFALQAQQGRNVDGR